VFSRLGLFVFVLTATVSGAIAAAPVSRANAVGLGPTAQQTVEVLPSYAARLASAPVPAPTVTPLPPPIWPPPDAAGTAHTTPPLANLRPGALPSPPALLWFAQSDAITVAGNVIDGQLYIPVVVDGHRKIFLVDTAAPTQIDSGEIGDEHAANVVIGSLQIGDLRLNNVTVKVSRVRPYSETYLGWAADGVLGSELFERFPAAIDYEASALTVYRTSDAAKRARPGDATVVPVQMVRDDPAIEGMIDGAAGSFILASGFDGFVTLGWNFAKAKRMLHDGEGIAELRLARPDGEMAGRTLRLHTFSIGSLSINRPIVGIIGNPPGADGLPDTAGVIGDDLLQRFFVLLDEPGGSLALAPRGAQTDPSFDRSGLWLVNRDGSIVVRSVTRRSPAEAAGLKSGDVVLRVGGRPVGAIDLAAARAALAQAAGRTVPIEYRRDGRVRDTVVTLRSLL